MSTSAMFGVTSSHYYKEMSCFGTHGQRQWLLDSPEVSFRSVDLLKELYAAGAEWADNILN